MKRIALLVAILWPVALFSAPSAEAQLETTEFSWWKLRALDCGDSYQRYYSVGLQDLLGDWPGDLWRAARKEGANDEQIDVMEKEFKRGRERAREIGWRRSNVNIRNSFITGRLEKAVKRRLRYCFDVN